MNDVIRVGLLGVVLSACSGGGDSMNFGPEIAPTPSQQSAIVSNTRSLSAMAQANLSGQAASSAAIDLAFGGPRLLGMSVGIGAAPRPGVPAVAAGPSRLGPDGCEVVTGSSITWTQCQDDGATIDGGMSWSPGHVDLDLHATASGAALQLDYAFTGALTISDTAIEGDTDVSFTASDGAGSHHSAIHTQIDVQVAMGCIYDGTLTVIATGEASHALQVVWIGCNMFRVRNG